MVPIPTAEMVPGNEQSDEPPKTFYIVKEDAQNHINEIAEDSEASKDASRELL